jgi:serine/threonine protein kinase
MSGIDQNAANRGRLRSHTPGDTIAERFRVLTVAGRGSEGSVYAVTDPDGRTFTCTELDRLEGTSVPPEPRAALVEWFCREATALASTSHQHLPRATLESRPLSQLVCTDCGAAFLGRKVCPECNGRPVFVENRHYLLLEQPAGETLAEVLSRSGRPAAWSQISSPFRSLLGAAAHLHELSLVHGDIKPERIRLETGTGRAILMDPGRVKVVDDPPHPSSFRLISAKTSAYGTPGFAAPEVYRNERTAASDIYALGMLLFWALTDRDPRSDQLAEMVKRGPAAFNPGIPPEVAALITRAIAPLPAERFTTVQEMAAALPAEAPGSPPVLDQPPRKKTPGALILAGLAVALFAPVQYGMQTRDRLELERLLEFSNETVLAHTRLGADPRQLAWDRALIAKLSERIRQRHFWLLPKANEGLQHRVTALEKELSLLEKSPARAPTPVPTPATMPSVAATPPPRESARETRAPTRASRENRARPRRRSR